MHACMRACVHISMIDVGFTSSVIVSPRSSRRSLIVVAHRFTASSSRSTRRTNCAQHLVPNQVKAFEFETQLSRVGSAKLVIYTLLDAKG